MKWLINDIIVFFFCGFLSCTLGFSQSGNPYITNYPFSSKSGQLRIQQIEQSNNKELILATAKGIAFFDGTNWDLLKLNNYPLAIQRVAESYYVSSTKDFGCLIKTESGEYNYNSLSDSLSRYAPFWCIKQVDNQLLFYSSKAIIAWDIGANKLEQVWHPSPGEPFLGGFIIGHKAYVNILNTGFHMLTKNGLQRISTANEIMESEVVFSEQTTAATIIGMDNSVLLSYDGNKITVIEHESANYIKESGLSGGKILGENLLALSTLTGGCVIINYKTGKTIEVINYHTGLPDDEIIAIGLDNNNGLWLAHEFGLSRVNYHFPIKNYTSYPGLEGNLLSVLSNKNELYVSTSEGVYYLDEVKSYKEVEVLLKKKVERVVPIETNYTSPIIENKPEEEIDEISAKVDRKQQRKEKRTNKKRWWKKDQDEETEEIDELSVDGSTELVDSVKEAKNNKPKKIRRKKPALEDDNTQDKQMRYALESIKYIYKQVEGIDDKCKELVLVNDAILVAGNKGVYEIKGNKSKTIVTGRYVNKIYKSHYNERVYVGTKTGLITLQIENGKWVKSLENDELKSNIISIVERDESNLWLGSDDKALNVKVDVSGSPLKIKQYGFNTETNEEVYVREIYGKPFFFLRSGIYGYDVDADSMYYNEEVNERFFNRYKYIFSQNTITWIFANNEWVNINHEPELLSLKSYYLHLFNNVQNIYVDHNQNLWVVDGTNGLYFIKASEIPSSEQEFNIFFSSVKNGTGASFSLTELNFHYDNSALTFSFSAPYYVKADGTKYQYIINGLMHEWSDWSSSTSINFPFIPEGSYKIRVRAKSVFGQISEEKELDFVIRPPFWRTWWFYVLAAMYGIIMVVFIVKWREKNLKREQHILEEKVKLRTHQLDAEKQKVEDLLHNILPLKTAEELKQKGKATARYYNLTSVLFTDFKGFTKISETITPVELVKELDECFIAFDQITSRFNIEKIKTIGDAYMCAGGVPVRNQSNPIEAVLAGLHICKFMKDLQANRMKQNQPFWELRLGIHSGPLIAGVVGKKKFAYDVWGDTVNTASRMESSGEPGKVNISSATYELVKKYFDCEPRGMVSAKGKGNMEMYFLNRLKPEYCCDEHGLEPNEQLNQIINDLR